MTNTRVIIEGNEIDLPTGTIIATTFQSFNIADLKSRYTNYTNKFRAALTPNNIKTFEYANYIYVDSKIPFRKLSCKVIQDGVELISYGTAFIYDCAEGFEISIFSGGFDFFNTMGEKTLDQIDTAAFDTYPGSPENILSNPVIDYGQGALSPSSIAQTGKEYYCVPYVKLLELTIKHLGYEKSGNIFVDSKLLAMHVPGLGYGKEFTNGFTRPKEFLALRDTSVIFNATSVPLAMNFTKVVFNGGFYDGNNTYTVDENNYGGTYFWMDVFAEIDLANLSFGGGATGIRIKLVSGAGVYFTNLITTTGLQKLELSDRVVLDPTGSPVTRVPGLDGAFLFVEISSWINIGTPGGTCAITFGARSKFYNKVITDKTVYNGVLYKSVQALLPSLPMKDLFQDFAVRFGVLFKDVDKTLHCKTFQEITRDRKNAADWTDKYVPGVDPIQFAYGTFGQSNALQYADADDLDKELGTGYINIDDEKLPPLKTLFKSSFAKSDTVKYGSEGAGYITIARVPTVEVTYSSRAVPRGTLVTVKSYGAVPFTGNLVWQDGYYQSLVAGNTILVNDEGNETLNGIWEVPVGLGAWVRNADYNTSVELQNALVNIEKGKFKDSWWLQSVNPVTLGTTSIKFILSGAQSINEYDRVVKESNDPGPRILMVRDKYASEPTLNNGTLSVYKVGYFTDDAAPDGSADFQAFIDKYYIEFTAALQTTKVITRNYNLSGMDIANLDFFNLIYDNGIYYLLVSVVNYVPNTISKVKLFKVS